MATEYLSTNLIFEAIKGQVEDQIQGDVDSVVAFDGTLQKAVSDHFGQSVRDHSGAVVFFGFSDDRPDATSGSGKPLRQEMTLDFYVIVRAKGRGRYHSDRERLFDLSDKMMFDVFDADNLTPEMQARCPTMRFQFRRRQETGAELMAHLIRFVGIAKRA